MYIHMKNMSDSEGEVVTRKQKSTKIFDSDDNESDNDNKSEKSSGFVDHSDISQGSSKSLSSKCESDKEQRKDASKNLKSDNSPTTSKRSGSCDDEDRSQSRKSDSSSDRSRSRSRSRKSSSSSDRSKSRSRSSKSSSSSDRSRSRSRSSKSSSSSNRSRSQSRKSDSSGDRSKKSQSENSNSPGIGSHRSRKSDSSDDKKRPRSRKSNSSDNDNLSQSQSKKSDSSDDEKRPRSKKSNSSDNDSLSQSQSKKSDSSDDQSQSRTRKSDSSEDEIKSQSRAKKSKKNRIRSKNLDSSDDENQSVSSKTSTKHDSDEEKSSESEIKSQSQPTKPRKSRIRVNKLDSSDDENQSISNKKSKKHDSDEDRSASPKQTTQESNNHVQKSGGKFSLITESDLESEKDDEPMANESASDDNFSQMNKKSKKLHKKKPSSSKKSSKQKSNGFLESANSSESDTEEKSPKRVQKPTAKRKSETNSGKGSKSSKKEKDPLLSIRSETQRMIREGRISLPYHQPKQHTLHEFLQRRRTAPSMPLKATSEVLKNVCEQLTIKQKEVEDFYKSESEHSDTEPRADLPEKNTTDEVDSTAKDIESTSIDPIVENNQQSMEVDHEDKLESTLVRNDDNEVPSPIVLEQNEDTNLAPTANSTEPVDSSEPKQPDENPQPEEPAEISIPEQDTFEFIVANGSNPQNDPKSDQITAMEVDHDTSNENVTKSNETANEVLPDSIDFVLELQDSCNVNTEEFAKPSNKPESKLIQDSDDLILSIEESPRKDNEAETNQKNIEVTSKPVFPKDLMKNRIEALLLTRNIKLSTIKLDSAPESIQFEIPSYRQEPSGIHELKAKFVKHSMAKNKRKSVPSQLNVTTTQTNTDGEVTGITKETLTLGLNDDENEFSNPKFQAPGAKHAYLKKKMLDMLISKKEATWNEYQNEKRKYYGSDSDAENDIDGNDDEDSASCKKLNFEPYHPEDEPDDEELIEDDVVYEEKTRDKNCYLDEEAEVSGDEDDEFENHAEQEDDDSIDSDGLDFTVKDDSPPKPTKTAETTGIKKLFNYNTTGVDLGKLISKNYNRDTSSKSPKLNVTAENKLLGLESISQPNSSQNISTSQIMDLCSGTFVTQDPSKDSNAVADTADDDFFVDDSQNISLTLPDTDNTIETATKASKKDTPSEQNDEEEDEEEEMIVRRKPTMRIVEDSDDEAEITEPTNDANEDDISDEETAANDDQEEENINDDENEEEFELDDVEAEEFGYNSEEELVTYDKAAVRGFLENEAELSGSEWGSEDENERDLDTLEKEAGDDDDIDADALKEELGKIHMRQLLDDDQHDVRLLKEMLLEDGELHSDAKRQRKFQWKNLGDGDDFFKNHNYDSDDDNNLNDDDNDESEEHWRKIRHERETFLSQQEKKSILNETTAETVESSFIQLTSTKIVNENITAKIIQRTSTNSTSSKDMLSQELLKNNPKFNCGSFLSRGKLLLSKMSLTVTDTKGNIKGPKNGKNFVFGAKSPEKQPISVSIDNPVKRKFNSSLPNDAKRKKLIVENVTSGATSILARLAMSEEL